MTDYSELVKALRECANWIEAVAASSQYAHDELVALAYGDKLRDAADAIEALQAEVERLRDKLCDWCAVCPEERRKPEDCEMLSETPVMYGPSDDRKE